MILAIAAAVIALASVAFGMFVKRNPLDEMKAPNSQIESAEAEIPVAGGTE